MAETPIPAAVSIRHIHLKVADLERAIRFYCDVIGFELVAHLGSAAFVSAGGYHHRIGLNTWESKDGQPPAPGTTGLYHFAINYPTRRDLARAYKRLADHNWPIDGSADHTSHEALYLHDPDFNGIELAWDRDPSHWHAWYGATLSDMHVLNKPLDFNSLLAELDTPSEADMGPIHLGEASEVAEGYRTPALVALSFHGSDELLSPSDLFLTKPWY